jgi:hypothetical protein
MNTLLMNRCQRARSGRSHSIRKWRRADRCGSSLRVGELPSSPAYSAIPPHDGGSRGRSGSCMLCGLHRVYFDSDEGPEGAAATGCGSTRQTVTSLAFPAARRRAWLRQSAWSAKSKWKRRLTGTLRGTDGRRVQLKERRGRTLRRGMTMLKAEARNDKRGEASEPEIGATLVG